MEQMVMTIKTEVDAAAISTVHIDSEIRLNHLKGESGLLQSVKGEPVLSLKEEILEDATQSKTMDQMEMSISNEVQMATTPSEHSNSEIELNLEQDSGLLQSVKRDFTSDALVKEEILEDTDQDGCEQQGVHVSSTPAGTGHVNEACSTSLIHSLNVKNESSEMDIGPIVLQHMDAHYTINKISDIMERLLKPERFDVDPTCVGAEGKWKHWKRTFENFVNEIEQVTDGNKFQLLCNYVAANVFQYINDSENYNAAITLLDSLYVTKRSEIFARHCLASRNQQPGESVSEYLQILKQKSKDCDFKAVKAEQCKNEYIRDAFIRGLMSPRIRERLLENTTITLENAFDQARALELAEIHSASYLTSPNPTPVAAMPMEHQKENIEENHSAATNPIRSGKCFFCGYDRHFRSACPAKDVLCRGCGKKGHYQKIKLNLEQDSGLLQSVKRDFTSDALVKEEILEDTDQDCLTPHDAIMKERAVREHQLVSDCRVHVMTLNVFQCDICHGVYTDKLRLLQHLQTVHVCRLQASLVEKVRKTNKRTAAGSISSCFRCTACGKTFSKAHLMSTHRKLHERHSATSGATSSSVAGPSNMQHSEAAMAEPKPFKCDVCEKRYSSANTLSQHKRYHSGVGLSVCRVCGAKFNMKYKLASHFRTHTGEKPFQCDTCNGRFTHSGDLTKHKRVHTGEKPFQCDTCNGRFTHSGDLTKHKRVHTGEKPFQCNICNARFTTNSDLTKHKRVHSGEKPFQCNICNARFTTNGDLTKHRRVHTGEKPHQCDTCDARFTDSSNLIRHQRVHTGQKKVHTGEKPFQCDTCDARFARSTRLTRHQRVHTGEKPYQCDTCDARFKQSSNLIRHQRVHTGQKRVHAGEKPFQCDTCGALFARSTHLTRHQRVHSGEKPYQCDTCDARFARSTNLTRHRRVHSGEKPFECTECESKFTQRSHLKTHVRRRHPK